MNPGKRQLRLVEASTTRRSKAIEDMERLGVKGLKAALILAQLGSVYPLAHLLAASKIAIMQGENILRAVYGVEDEN